MSPMDENALWSAQWYYARVVCAVLLTVLWMVPEIVINDENGFSKTQKRPANDVCRWEMPQMRMQNFILITIKACVVGIKTSLISY